MNTQIRRGLVLAGALLVLPLYGCFTTASVHPRALPSNLKIAGFTVEPQPIEGLAVPAGRETFVQLLANAATDQAARSLAQQGVAGAAPAGRFTVKGSVRMIVSLPPDVYGLAAARRNGTLATARVQLLDASGNVLAVREAGVAWSDVRWLTRGRYRQNRPVAEVLLEGARLSVDRAVGDLLEPVSVPERLSGASPNASAAVSVWERTARDHAK